MPASEFSDVFISYRRKDVEFVKPLVKKLQEAGKEVWVDWEDIPPGTVGFTDEIKRGLDGADALICVLSPDYLESPYCVDLELKYAIGVNKRVVPIVYREFDGYEVPTGIGHINWIYFLPHAGQENTFEESFPKILQALDSDVEHIRQHKRLLIRALDWETHSKKPAYLLTGDELMLGEQWLSNVAGKDPHPTDLHKQYIVTSRHQAMKSLRTRMSLMGGALVVSLFLAVLAVIGFWQSTQNAQIATNAQATAVRRSELSDARLLASHLPEFALGDPSDAYALALSLLEMQDPPLVARWAANQVLLNFGAVRSFPLTQPSERLAFAGVWLPDNTFIDSYCITDSIFTTDCDTAAVTRRNMETGEILNTVTYEGDAVVLFSDDGQLGVMVSCANLDCSQPTFEVIDTTTGEILHTIYSRLAVQPAPIDIRFDDYGYTIPWGILFGLPNHQMLVLSCIAWDADNYTCGSSVQRYDLDSGELLMDYSDILPLLTDLNVFDNGTKVVSRVSDSEVIVWDVESGEVLEREVFDGSLQDFILNEQTEQSPIEIRSSNSYSALLNNGDLLQGEVCLYNCAPTLSINNTREIDESFTYAGGRSFETGPTSWFGISPDQSYAATLGDIGITIWDINSGREGPRRGYGNFEFIPGTHTIIISDSLVLNLDTGDYRDIFTPEDQIYLYSTLLMPDSNSIIGLVTNDTSSTPTLDRYDFTTGELLQSAPINTNQDEYFAPQLISPDGAVLLLSSPFPEDPLLLWDLQIFQPLHELNLESNVVDATAFSADSHTLYMMMQNGELWSWDVQTGTRIDTRRLTNDSVVVAAFSANGRQVLIAAESEIRLIDLETGETLHEIDTYAGNFTAVLLPADGRTMVSIDNTYMLYWDLTTGEIAGRYEASGNLLGISDDNEYAVYTSRVSGSPLDYVRLMMPDDQLIEWAHAHLQISELTCEDRERYGTPVRCN